MDRAEILFQQIVEILALKGPTVTPDVVDYPLADAGFLQDDAAKGDGEFAPLLAAIQHFRQPGIGVTVHVIIGVQNRQITPRRRRHAQIEQMRADIHARRIGGIDDGRLPPARRPIIPRQQPIQPREA